MWRRRIKRNVVGIWERIQGILGNWDLGNVELSWRGV
jgi:hypothetical protein